MKKNELEAVVGNFRHYILLMHDFCNVPIPEEFDPEVQAVTCRDSLVKMAEVGLANRLMMAASGKEDLAELADAIDKTRRDWGTSDHPMTHQEYLNAQAGTTPHLVSENSSDQTLQSE